jgi:DNA-binding GntR family transcriptional regulator
MELASLNIKNRIHRSFATVKEHKKIMDMLRKRDSNGAVEMMRQHILTTQELLIKQVIIHRD